MSEVKKIFILYHRHNEHFSYGYVIDKDVKILVFEAKDLKWALKKIKARIKTKPSKYQGSLPTLPAGKHNLSMPRKTPTWFQPGRPWRNKRWKERYYFYDTGRWILEELELTAI